MPPRLRPPVLAAFLLLLGACADYPLGLDAAEWERLPPAQQLEARQAQAERDAAAAARRAAAEAEARRLAEQRAEAERRRVAALRAEARYGDIIQCVIEDAVADFRPGWRTIRPLGVSLVRGETAELTLVAASRDHGRRLPLWATFSADGMTVVLCRHAPARRGLGGGNDCHAMAGTAADYQTGLRRPVDMPEILRGAMRCAYAPAPDMPPSVILRGAASGQ